MSASGDFERQVAAFIDKAVAVPYKPLGRDWRGWDCWGLVYVMYRDLLGIYLPMYDAYQGTEDRFAQNTLILNGMGNGCWQEVEKPEPLDLAAIKVSGCMCHVGVWVGNRWMLHTLESGTRCERTDSVSWNRRIAFYARNVFRNDD
jgi:cell wall-associated NlpC family hydrolase